jgi:hypothetical protein
MELLESGAITFIWITIVLLAAVIGLSTTDILKLKKEEEDQAE